MEEQTQVGTPRNVGGLAIVLAIAMIALGAIALMAPFAAALGVAVFIGAVMVASGIAHIAYAFAAEGLGKFAWRILVGVVYVICGFYLVSSPAMLVATLTYVLALVLVFEGAFRAITSFGLGSRWMLVNGIITIALGFMIFSQWPASSIWVLGTIFGINLIVGGFTRLMIAMAARKVAGAIASRARA